MSKSSQSSAGRFHEEGLRVTLHRFASTQRGVLAKPFNFQVSPLEEFAWVQGANHGEFDTLSRGQFSRRGGRELLTLEMKTVAVDYQPRWASYVEKRPNAPNPQNAASLMRQLVNLGTPVMLVARSAYWDKADLRLPVTLRSVQSAERAGEPESRYLDLSFVEWREQQLDQKGRGKSRKRRALPTTVEIKSDGVAWERPQGGQPQKIGSSTNKASFQDLAQFFYGDPAEWRTIERFNGISDFAPTRPLDELKKKGKTVRKLRIPDVADPKTGGIEVPS